MLVFATFRKMTILAPICDIAHHHYHTSHLISTEEDSNNDKTHDDSNKNNDNNNNEIKNGYNEHDTTKATSTIRSPATPNEKHENEQQHKPPRSESLNNIQNNYRTHHSPPPNNTKPSRFLSASSVANGLSNTKKLDPPARERPADNVWPERDCLSFTRSLVFYGAGSITDEHERACQFIMEARAMRKKYHGSRGTMIHHDDLKRIVCDNEDSLGFVFNDDGLVEVGIMIDDDNDDNANASVNSETMNGVEVTKKKIMESLVSVPNIDEFMKDYRQLEVICSDGAMRSFW